MRLMFKRIICYFKNHHYVCHQEVHWVDFYIERCDRCHKTDGIKRPSPVTITPVGDKVIVKFRGVGGGGGGSSIGCSGGSGGSNNDPNRKGADVVIGGVKMLITEKENEVKV